MIFLFYSLNPACSVCGATASRSLIYTYFYNIRVARSVLVQAYMEPFCMSHITDHPVRCMYVVVFLIVYSVSLQSLVQFSLKLSINCSYVEV